MIVDEDLEIQRMRTSVKEQSIPNQQHEPSTPVQTQMGRSSAVTWGWSWLWQRRTPWVLWSNADWWWRYWCDKQWKRQSQPQGFIKQGLSRKGSKLLWQAAFSCGKCLLAMLCVLLVTNIQIRWIWPAAGTGKGCQGDSKKGKPVL